jgi:hypothetical protein
MAGNPAPATIRLWLLALIAAGVAAITVSNVVNTAYLASGSSQARVSRAATLQAVRLLVECTTAPALREPPERHPKASDCWVRSQKQQADIVGQPRAPINTVTVAAAACGADHPGDVSATLACVRIAIR